MANAREHMILHGCVAVLCVCTRHGQPKHDIHSAETLFGRRMGGRAALEGYFGRKDANPLIARHTQTVTLSAEADLD